MTGASIVVPTLGRPSLRPLLDALARQCPDAELLIVDDRPDQSDPLPLPDWLPPAAKVVAGRAAGPAAARNAGWTAARHDWIVFLDDDVVPTAGWYRALLGDLDVPATTGGVQARVEVPRPAGRRPTDWERATAALTDGAWLTADMAYRRSALTAVGGFDERFPRAFREDADLAYRVRRAGWTLHRGRRTVLHPIRPESRWVSLRTQRGNADDALLRRLHGPDWRRRLDIPPGRRPRHALITAAALATVAGAAATAAGRTTARWLTAGAGLAWLAGTAEFAAARIAPGPRTRAEVTTMTLTSVAIPPLAVGHWLAGWWRTRGAAPWPGAAGRAVTERAGPR